MSDFDGSALDFDDSDFFDEDDYSRATDDVALYDYLLDN